MIRLSDEAALVELSEGVRSYYIRVKNNKAAAVVSLMHVEHLYYKHDTIACFDYSRAACSQYFKVLLQILSKFGPCPSEAYALVFKLPVQ